MCTFYLENDQKPLQWFKSCSEKTVHYYTQSMAKISRKIMKTEFPCDTVS